MFKVRPLTDILAKKFLQWDVVHKSVSIGESMVKYFRRHPAKQFISCSNKATGTEIFLISKGMPVSEYKKWMIASSDGYCYAFDIYCRKAGMVIWAQEW